MLLFFFGLALWIIATTNGREVLYSHWMSHIIPGYYRCYFARVDTHDLDDFTPSFPTVRDLSSLSTVAQSLA